MYVVGGGVLWNLSRKGTLNKGHLSNEDTACSPGVYKSTFKNKIGTSLYTGQPAGSQRYHL